MKKNNSSQVRKQEKVIFACAWCDSSTYTHLKRGQVYSHGMCSIHKEQFIQRSHLRQVVKTTYLKNLL